MEEGGPMCVCEDGYIMYEDGKLGCLTIILPTDFMASNRTLTTSG